MKFFFTFIFFLSTYFSYAQFTDWAKIRLDSLCSEKFYGRGYIRQGDALAAQFIAGEFRQIGVKPVTGFSDYFQSFSFWVNRFPNAFNCTLDEQSLNPGFDVIPHPDCPSVVGEFTLIYPDSETFDNANLFKRFLKRCKYSVFVVIHENLGAKILEKERYLDFVKSPGHARGIIWAKAKLTHAVSRSQHTLPQFDMLSHLLAGHPDHWSLEVESELHMHTANNVMGIIPGTTYPDSFMVVGAHYDHLGGIGSQCYFPGANDNASGVVMMLSMARYFKEHPMPFSMIFIAFAGEEMGLLGSTWMAAHPPIPLNKWVFMLNLDLEGTGDKGTTVVNAEQFPHAFNRLKHINQRDSLLPSVFSRGTAWNSDHAPFYEAGVPCFYPYLMGDYTWYHQPQDAPEVLPFSRFDQATWLWIRFFEEFRKVD